MCNDNICYNYRDSEIFRIWGKTLKVGLKIDQAGTSETVTCV